MTSREVAFGRLASFRNHLSITFVPCGYLHCTTECYKFPALSPLLGTPPSVLGPGPIASDLSCLLHMLLRATCLQRRSDCFKESDYDDSLPKSTRTPMFGVFRTCGQRDSVHRQGGSRKSDWRRKGSRGP